MHILIAACYCLLPACLKAWVAHTLQAMLRSQCRFGQAGWELKLRKSEDEWRLGKGEGQGGSKGPETRSGSKGRDSSKRGKGEQCSDKRPKGKGM